MSRKSCLSLLPVLLVLHAAPAVAEDANVGHPEDRTVGGYRFIPSQNIPNPFVTSHLRNNIGAGMFLDASLPLFSTPDTTVSLNGDLLLAILEFEYSYAPDDRVSFRISGAGATRVGTGGEALLAQGVTAASAMSAGTTILLHRGERFQLSAAADAGPASTIRVDLAGFVMDLLDQGLDTASLTRNDNGVQLSGGARAAYAFNAWSGVFGFLDGVYANSLHVDKGGVLLGAAVSADFGQKGGLPIGLMLTGRYSSLNATRKDSGNDMQFGFGVFYTGRDAFSLGLETQYVHLPVSVPQGAALNGLSTGLTTRLYF